MRRVLPVAAVALALVALTPGGASAKTLPVAQWAPKFCAAISTFQSRLESDGSQAGAVLSGNITNLRAAKAALTTFMGKAVGDAGAALSALKRAGAPDTPGGSKIAAKFTTAFQTLHALYVSARKNAAHLPTKTLGA